MINGTILRPGGFDITMRGLALADLPQNAKIADIGCGIGDTLNMLNHKLGHNAIGVDVTSSSNDNIIKADAKALPFHDNSFDCLMFECSFSKMNLPDAVTAECARVLKPNGKLIISDLYARGEQTELSGMLGRLDSRKTILNRNAIFGFDCLNFEDHSNALVDMWASLVFEHGIQKLCDNFKTDAETLSRIKCGYFLAVFSLNHKYVSRTDNLSRIILGLDRNSSPQEKQLALINRTLQNAQNTAFYSQHLHVTNVGSFDEFEKLPFTTSRDIIEYNTQFAAVPAHNISRIVTRETSGTTGAAKRVYFTQEDVKKTEDFFTYALSDFVSPGDSVAVFMSGRTENGLGDLLSRAFSRLNVNTFLSGEIFDFAKAAETAQKCGLYIGKPAPVLKLMRLFPALKPHTILLSADYIPDSIVQYLQVTRNCKVIRHFGMTETCFGGAVDCAFCGGQHIRHADFYVEIADPETGKNLKNGTAGEIVITTLRHTAFPLVRYKTGDIGVLEDGECACGGTLNRLGKVYGRRENLKERLNIHMLDELMFSYETLLDYSAHITGPDSLELTIEGDIPGSDELESLLGISVSIKYAQPALVHDKRHLFCGVDSV